MVTKNFLSAGSIVFALSLLTSTTNDWGSYVALTVSDWSASITVFIRAGLAAIGRLPRAIDQCSVWLRSQRAHARKARALADQQ